MYLTHMGRRIWSLLIHIYFKKWFSWPPKHCCTPQVEGKKTYLPTLNVMILQMVRNKYVRFGGHVEVQVSYNIFRLEVPKKALILHNPFCFQEGLF
jgi:hypothetical protein